MSLVWNIERRGWEWSAPGGWRITRYRSRTAGTRFLLYRGERLVTARATLARAKEVADERA
jgi:hypothetical protein